MNLIELYAEVADITHKICATCDPAPFHCCVSLGCGHTKFWAKHAWDTDLPVQQSGELPYMTPTGCRVKPFLRPVCTMAVCRPNALPPRYFELLELIAAAEQERWQSPEGQARAARIPGELRTNPEAIVSLVGGKPKD